MIYGIGIDTATISRLEKSMQNPHFAQRVFSQAERSQFQRLGAKPQSIAANFAAKEAFSKALGTGLSGFEFRELSCLRTKKGAPSLAFTGALAARMRQLRLHAKVSLTHEGDFASAVVVLYTL